MAAQGIGCYQVQVIKTLGEKKHFSLHVNEIRSPAAFYVQEQNFTYSLHTVHSGILKEIEDSGTYSHEFFTIIP